MSLLSRVFSTNNDVAPDPLTQKNFGKLTTAEFLKTLNEIKDKNPSAVVELSHFNVHFNCRNLIIVARCDYGPGQQLVGTFELQDFIGMVSQLCGQDAVDCVKKFLTYHYGKGHNSVVLQPGYLTQ
jgi:hypothetical protein